MFTHVKNSLGQSLLEVTIVIGLVVIVLTAVASLVIHGLEVSQVAQNQAQAAKLARQGIEIVRNIRDTKGTVCISSSLYRWNNSFWGSSCTSTTCYFKIRPISSGSCSYDSSTTDPWLQEVASNTEANREAINGTQFTRLVEFDPGANSEQVKVTAIVYWTDYSGPHSTSVVTILANI